MEALITSCGRFDLLSQTLESLYKDLKNKVFVTINEDGLTKIGQHKSIEKFLKKASGKYYFHCECDWEFNNHYDWINESLKIMEADSSVIKVLCRENSPHPCIHNHAIEDGVPFGYIEPWQNNGITWHGFSWNPGITRLDLLKKFIPFGPYEQDVAEAIYKAGYKVVELSKPIYKHIGDGRSTHE